jgi:DNA ligase-1
VGAAKQLVYRALATVAEVPVADVAQRLVGEWTPSGRFFAQLRGEDADATAILAHRPYPFFLAHPLERDPATLGARDEWLAEWKWDGIRAQLLVRAERATLWSRGEELVSDAFPEIVDAARALPAGVAIDGELMAWAEDADGPMPFAELQRRLNRKAPGPKLRRDIPATLVAYDLLEFAGTDIRAQPLAHRRATLATLVPRPPQLRLSPMLDAPDWATLAALRDESRARRAEGLMLKHADSAYGVGRTRGAWWKWKIDPYTVDAVMVYAQAGHGRRASLYTDYTFAVWDGADLVPFAKAYSGLDDTEIRAVDAWVRAHTLERFGPVRRVAPELVFELAFEGLQASPRHKSGIAVRFPRMLRWREDKPVEEADTLETLAALLPS